MQRKTFGCDWCISSFESIIIFLTFSATWYFISDDKNKLVSASEKAISSVVTISSSNNGLGSGVIFSKDGYIVTNLHILSSNNINVKLDNGKNYSANIIGIDKNADIAVLKIASEDKFLLTFTKLKRSIRFF